ncbi:MAG: TatD family hydrolase [Candidatus Moeniiplasma glomeromycotorum]|nr:TatD family hydrolase [Candidatus Moeniiplasma glomeromycotorum]MCE8169604.1 TatD family hydrolase [Candidatus Moeniiplasma glomeromycotorum]
MNKLTIFDTHCHLADHKYQEQDKNAKEIIQAAEKSGVKYILNTGQDMPTNQLLLKQLEVFPNNLYGALGLHPNSNEDLKEENLQWIENQLTNQRIIAIGEIGLDYYRTFTEIEKQKVWFKKQLELAKKYDLPVLLHIRGEEENKFMEVFNEAYEIVKKTGAKKGILHCFTGDWEIAQKFLDLGFYISFAGNITYKNAKWKNKWGEVLEKMPIEKMLVETDAPYLTPEPLRGKINYPQNIVYTLKKVAEVRNMDIEEVGEKIYLNTLRLFNFLPSSN